MPLFKHAYPILEYDTEPRGVIRPNRHGGELLPERCVMTFFGEVLDGFIAGTDAPILKCYKSEMRDFPVYGITYKSNQLCVVQAVVGSASIATMADFLFAYGVKTLVACGGCGVLRDIPAGDVIVPTVALRDEGASYNYLPPSRDIALDADIIDTIKAVLRAHSTPYIEAKTWTTDAFYRETRDMIAYRVEEGCSVVEMECATMAAVARFRGARFGQLLYSGDILTDHEHYDDRDWPNNLTARGLLFRLALETAIAL